MNSLGLHEAAAFLRMHPEEVRRRARLGLLPGAKPWKRWVFIEADLADYLRSLYSPVRQALRVTPGKENECHFVTCDIFSRFRRNNERSYLGDGWPSGPMFIWACDGSRATPTAALAVLLRAAHH